MKEEEVGTLLLGNDKNSVMSIIYQVFFCAEAFGTKLLSKGLFKVKNN